jgi:hypothetical protein
MQGSARVGGINIKIREFIDESVEDEAELDWQTCQLTGLVIEGF